MRRRTKARVWALQILYAAEISGTPVLAQSDAFFREIDAAEDKKAFTRRILECFDAHAEAVDRQIEEAVANWRMERLSIIDKNILRISICELLYMEDIPGKASVDEAVGLSHIFGGDDSPRFVNGVLDSILHRPTESR
jgi:N utilization substance protein B